MTYTFFVQKFCSACNLLRTILFVKPLIYKLFNFFCKVNFLRLFFVPFIKFSLCKLSLIFIVANIFIAFELPAYGAFVFVYSFAISFCNESCCFITEIMYLCSTVKCLIFVTLGGSNNKHLFHSEGKGECFFLFLLKKYLLFYPLKLHLFVEFRFYQINNCTFIIYFDNTCLLIIKN